MADQERTPETGDKGKTSGSGGQTGGQGTGSGSQPKPGAPSNPKS